MVTIKKAAAITGVPEHTLRAWERRYDLISTARTEAGYRVYDEAALERIRAMNDLVRAGWAPRDAAVEAARNGRGPVERDADERLLRAAADLDDDGVARVLDEQFARGSFETVVDGWLMPALVRLGRAWADQEVSVAGEHLVSAVTMRRLAVAYEDAGGGRGGPVVLVGAPPGVEHELSLLAFATAARRAGVNTVYLGAQVPPEAWRLAVLKVKAKAAVSSLHRRTDAVRLVPVAEALADVRGLDLWTGGRHQHRAPAPFRPLGHSISAAAARLAGRRPGPAPAV
ncbi:MAG: MerR family transcriptional regulator [Propionibacteriaceae bacterium]|nr:MerR family transcriptional regulator [Propionibacteriaceae bacterium]